MEEMKQTEGTGIMGEEFPAYSVLLPVCAKEKPAIFREAVDSILYQTVLPSEFVFVFDGELSDEFHQVVRRAEKVLGEEKVRLLQLEKQANLSFVLNAGLKACTCSLIARMDADDVSLPNRCEQQLEVFMKNPKVAVCSGFVKEFSDCIDQASFVRKVPETHEKIREYAKKRCPFNHPCVMFRKDAVLSSGGYGDSFFEDYSLWIHMILNGMQGYNLQKTILYMRCDDNLYRRRTGKKLLRSRIELLREMRELHFISFFRFHLNVISYAAVCILPNGLRKWIYQNFLRKQETE